MQIEVLFFFGVLAAMVGGVTIIVLGLRSQAHRNELRHQERMAMIERGIVPPPEMGGWAPPPAGGGVTFRDQRVAKTSRSQMTFGIVLIGAGFAFMAVIGIAAGTPSVAIGIGGAVVIFGAALIVISQVVRPGETMTTTVHARQPIPPVPSSPLSSQAPPPMPPDQNL
jgi:hypothetical protein